MNIFALSVIVLQFGAAATYVVQGKCLVATLWALYATANIVLYKLGNI